MRRTMRSFKKFKNKIYKININTSPKDFRKSMANFGKYNKTKEDYEKSRGKGKNFLKFIPN